MKFPITLNPKFVRILHITLLSITGALILLLVIGTIFGIARSDDAKPLLQLGKTSDTGQTVQAYNEDIRVFSGLGRLRIPLSNQSTLILSIAFPYYHNDTAFTEELAAKTDDLKSIASNYFSSLPAVRVNQIDEEKAKSEILLLYNNALRLGNIEALYFSDMMILDAGL
ncbi:MAG: hypothetical protein FWC19_02530 [Treponema sp.]|nr:hypothetical protein [Treponema sp.]